MVTHIVTKGTRGICLTMITATSGPLNCEDRTLNCASSSFPRREVCSVVWILAAMVGCTSAPSPKDAEQILRANIDQGAEQRLRVESFAKTDGIAAEVSGIKAYTMVFSARAVFVADAQYTVGLPLTNEGDRITTTPPTPSSNGNPWTAFIAGSQGLHPAKNGDRLQLNGRVSFEKRESGWRPTSLSFTFALDSTQRGQPGQTGSSAGTATGTGTVGTLSFNGPAYTGTIRSDERMTLRLHLDVNTPTCARQAGGSVACDLLLYAGGRPNLGVSMEEFRRRFALIIDDVDVTMEVHGSGGHTVARSTRYPAGATPGYQQVVVANGLPPGDYDVVVRSTSGSGRFSVLWSRPIGD